MNIKCLFGHDYKEVDRYLIVTGEDQIFKECKRCGKKDHEYSLDTFYGKANAPTYKEWLENKKIK